jgi:hypothetical protein
MGNSSSRRDRSHSRSRSRNRARSHSLGRNRRIVPEENFRDPVENRDRDVRDPQCRREQCRIEVNKERSEEETEQDKASSSTMPRSPPPPPPVPSRTVLIPGLINPLTPERVLPTSNFLADIAAVPDPCRDREERERKRENTDDTESTVPGRDRKEADRELPRKTKWISKRNIEVKCLDMIIKALGQKPSLTEDEYSRIEKEIKKEYEETVQRVTEMEERVQRIAPIPTIPKDFYKEHKSVLNCKRAMQFNDKRRMEMVLSHRHPNEVSSIKTLKNRNSCQKCYTVHTDRVSQESCRTLLTAGGPRILRHMAKVKSWQTHMQAVLVGFREYLYIPLALSTALVNCGQTITGEYNVGTADDLPIDRSEYSLFQQLQRVLELLPENKSYPVYVEFIDSPNQEGTQIENITGFIFVIQELQRTTWHELTVITSPYLAKDGDSDETQMSAAWTRQGRNSLVELTCLALGTPCINVPLQQGRIEETWSFWSKQPLWHAEPLSTPSGNVTAEMQRRIGIEFSLLFEHLKEHPNHLPREEIADQGAAGGTN